MTPIPYAKTAVVTRTKSRPLLLARAIESVLGQTDEDFVHVIVNDGGDVAELEQLLEGFRRRYEGRLLVVHNARSLGMEAASNVGIRASSSNFLVIHDDDDSWHPDFLARTTEHMTRDRQVKNLGGCVSYATEVHERIVDSKVVEVRRRSMEFREYDLTLWRMCAGNFFPPISFLYRREALEKTGVYREELPVQGDWEFNLRFMQHYEIALVKLHLAFYHMRVSTSTHDGQYSNSVEGLERHGFYNRYVRNELLRADVQAGCLGVGYLANVTPILLRLDRISLGALGLWESAKKSIRVLTRSKR